MSDQPHDIDTKLLILCPQRKACNLKTSTCKVWQTFQSAVIAQGLCPKFPKPYVQKTSNRFEKAGQDLEKEPDDG